MNRLDQHADDASSIDGCRICCKN